MARHNDVRALGYLEGPPRVRYLDIEKKELSQVVLTLHLVRGVRDFSSKNGRKGYDEVNVMIRNKPLMEFASRLEPFDVIDLKGSFITFNSFIGFECPECKTFSKDSCQYSVINPIFMNRVVTARDLEANNKQGISMNECASSYLRVRSELSNSVTLLGTCCRPPEMFSEKGNDIVNYQLDVMRKYRIREDDPDNTHDFPNIKSYGKIARNDYQYILKGSRIFIDGFIMTRTYEETHICPHCGAEVKVKRSVCEVVPYAVEYLNGCKDGALEVNRRVDEGEFKDED